MQIDAVITWVDGADPRHDKARRRYRARRFLDRALEPNAITEHRFRDNGELRYCVRSIKKHAPWIRRIHIVTDDQFPDYFNYLGAARAGIRLVSHREIFRGLELMRPVFNSRAIETLLWRIEGLAQHFIYFNDDMFLCGPIEPSDFYDGDGKAVIRGTLKDKRSEVDQTKLHGNSKYARAATLAEFPNDQYVCSAHVPHPMLRTQFERAFEKMTPLFMQNASYRFRDARQFYPVALHDHFVLQTGRAVLRGGGDCVHISGQISKSATEAELAQRFSRLFDERTRFACLNNMPSTVERLGVTEADLQRLFGPGLSFEQEGRSRLESLLLRFRAFSRFERGVPEHDDGDAPRVGREKVAEEAVRKRERRAVRRARNELFTELLRVVCERTNRKGSGFFLQIGANDGHINDPLSSTVKAFGMNGLCIEPLPDAFERLKQCYWEFPGVRLVNVAIGEGDGWGTLYKPKLPGMVAASGKHRQRVYASAERKASFLPEVARRIAAQKNQVPEEDARNLVEEVTVRVATLPRVLTEYGVDRVDVLQIDVEGYDYEVLKQFDFELYSPVLLNYEHQHLSKEDRTSCARMLLAKGYVLFSHGRDTCGIRAFGAHALADRMEEAPPGTPDLEEETVFNEDVSR